jgi:D-glycero-D-manno-heptose 1,7-bisphosphate phosphatase
MVNLYLKPIVQTLISKSRDVKHLILLDRDGTLNRDYGYTFKLIDLQVLYKNLDIIKEFISDKSLIVCISNQSGIGRGYFSALDATTFNLELASNLSNYGLPIDIFYMCPHTPNSFCLCRKPGTLMIEMALDLSRVSIEQSIFFGDSEVDRIASEKMGIKFVKVPKNNV